MKRWVFSGLIFSLSVLGEVSVRGRSLLTELEWDRLVCRIGPTGRLNLAWGPKSAIEITIPNFKSVIENESLVYVISNRETGEVSFLDHKWWVVDPIRHQNSSCRLHFSEMKNTPLQFRIAVTCKNLLPFDKSDGGLTDVEAEIIEEVITCEAP